MKEFSRICRFFDQHNSHSLNRILLNVFLICVIVIKRYLFQSQNQHLIIVGRFEVENLPFVRFCDET